jgi:hypothetical protein
MYKQLRTPDFTTVGTLGNCLQYARNVFDIPSKYPSAWEGWQNTDQHKDRKFPKNVAIALWFKHYGSYGVPPKYKNWGHIVIYRPTTKKFYSSPYQYGQKFAILDSIEEVERTYKADYVGWSTEINDVKVAKSVTIDDMYSQMFEGKKQNWSAKKWAEKAAHYRKRTIEEVEKNKKLTTKLKDCGDPTSNDQAVKDSLFNKIKGIFGK